MGAIQLERVSKQLRDLLQRDPSPSTSEVANELCVWESTVDTLQDILCGPCDERLLSNIFYHDPFGVPTEAACAAPAAAPAAVPAAALAAAPAAALAAAPAAAQAAAPAADRSAPTTSSATLPTLTTDGDGCDATGAGAVARVQAQATLLQRDLQLLLASIAALPQGPVHQEGIPS